MVVVLMAGAKRHLGLKKCLQLGGYASSSPVEWLCKQFTSWVVMQEIIGGCGSCITTRQAPWF